jgi:hypothetical protein
MLNDQSKNRLLIAPGSLRIFLVQYMAIVPFGTAIGLITLPIISTSSVSFNDFLILLALIVPLLLIGAGMLYIPNTYKYRICFDEKDELKIKRKKQILNSIKTDSINHIIAQKIKTNPGCRFKLVIKKNGNEFVTIFDEKTPFGTSTWESFAEKLSNLVNIPLEKESLVEG